MADIRVSNTCMSRYIQLQETIAGVKQCGYRGTRNTAAIGEVHVSEVLITVEKKRKRCVGYVRALHVEVYELRKCHLQIL